MLLCLHFKRISFVCLTTLVVNMPGFFGAYTFKLAHALTWEEAKRSLAQESFKIQADFMNIRIAKKELGMAQSQYFPAVSFRAASERFLKENATLGYRSFIGPRITWAMYQGGRVHQDVKQSKLNVYKKENSLNLSEVEEEANLRQVFANALFAKKNLALAEASLQRATINNRYVKLKYTGGQEFAWVYQSSQKTVAENEADLLKAQHNAKQALRRLQQILGEKAISALDEVSDQGFAIQSELTTLNIADFLENHPRYVMAQNDVQMAKANNKISKSKIKPDLLFRTDFIVADTDSEPVFPFWYAGVNVSFPIFEAGFHKKNIKVSQLKTMQAEKNLEQFKINQFEIIDQRYMAYQLALKNKEVAQLNLESIQNKYKLYQRQYREGLIDYPLWDTAQKELREAENLLINNIKAIQIEYGQLLLALGVTEDEI